MSVIIPTKNESPQLNIPKYFLGEWYSDESSPRAIISETLFQMFISETATLDFNFQVVSINPIQHEVTLTGLISDAMATYSSEIILKANGFVCQIPEALQGSIALDGQRMMQFFFIHPFVRFAQWN